MCLNFVGLPRVNNFLRMRISQILQGTHIKKPEKVEIPSTLLRKPTVAYG